MKLNYYADTDSLYIDLSERPSAESREITEGVVLDSDAEGNLVGIDIDNVARVRTSPVARVARVIARVRPESGFWRRAGSWLSS